MSGKEISSREKDLGKVLQVERGSMCLRNREKARGLDLREGRSE